jgi:hypothetical protein
MPRTFVLVKKLPLARLAIASTLALTGSCGVPPPAATALPSG